MAVSNKDTILINLSNGLLLEYDLKKKTLSKATRLRKNFINISWDIVLENFFLEAPNGEIYTYKKSEGLKTFQKPKLLDQIWVTTRTNTTICEQKMC